MYQKAFPVIDPVATGANIRRLRAERGLSVRDLQTYFGFEEPQAIYKWQKGKSLPSVDNLYALGALLEVPMEEILVPARPNLHMIVCEPQADACGSPLSGGIFIQRPWMRQDWETAQAIFRFAFRRPAPEERPPFRIAVSLPPGGSFCRSPIPSDGQAWRCESVRMSGRVGAAAQDDTAQGAEEADAGSCPAFQPVDPVSPRFNCAVIKHAAL